MRKYQYYYDYVFRVDDFLTQQECRKFIDLGEATGFGQAPVNTAEGVSVRTSIRSNSRALLDDVATSDELWGRVQPWVPSPFRGREAIGLNERFRYYRYDVGQAFAAHFDQAYVRETGEQSCFTFLVYLNDDFEGGATRFFQPEEFDVKPQAGSLLLFFHPQLHAGLEVLSGIKYVLRSDVMYQPDN